MVGQSDEQGTDRAHEAEAQALPHPEDGVWPDEVNNGRLDEPRRLDEPPRRLDYGAKIYRHRALQPIESRTSYSSFEPYSTSMKARL
eukprot:CAMPEP_0174896022 /NCGR_PEP_ID=MMETSP0167-20121228/10286_1 /TAXON_ID=38298 /ORGANISM="Rhodella maculata, Strain CCMP736" /LENGTH=86 /DNA_ID=CAMNT_0016135469 /DNA_START=116 /DNA_END=376 /DNA_ORIENTATION=+